MGTNWQMGEPQEQGAAVLVTEHATQDKESQVKLSLEMRNRGDVIILHCQGRVVYRDEAAALARVAGSLLEQTEKLVIDLSGVNALDSAGLGELALLYTRAQERSASLKYAGASRLVTMLLGLTNLDRVLDVHPSVELALEAIRDERVCAEC
jgi:anti-sigma B factor antagonist